MARMTKARLDRWAELKAEAAEISRRARALEAEAKAIEADAKADLEGSGKDSINRGGYRLEWVDRSMSISWKNELVARCGADVADEISNAAPRSRVVRITPPATAKAAA